MFSMLDNTLLEPVGVKTYQNLEKTVDRAQKTAVIEELGQVFTDSGAIVVCHYAGLTVAEMSDFRTQMREAGGSVRVAKNRLAKIALKDKDCEGLTDILSGQTVLAYAADPVTPAKIVEAFAKDNGKLVILGGAMGPDILDVSGVQALAKMPSREEVLASIIGAVSGVGGQVVAAVTAPATNLAGIAKTLAEREDA